MFTTKNSILGNVKRWFVAEMDKFKIEAKFVDILPLTKHHINSVLKMKRDPDSDDEDREEEDSEEEDHQQVVPFHQHKWFYGGEKRCGCNEAPLVVCSCGATRCDSCLPMETGVPWLWDFW